MVDDVIRALSRSLKVPVCSWQQIKRSVWERSHIVQHYVLLLPDNTVTEFIMEIKSSLFYLYYKSNIQHSAAFAALLNYLIVKVSYVADG